MASHASDVPADPTVVEIEPDEHYSSDDFRAFVEELLAGPEPSLETIGAAVALHDIRADADTPE